VQDPYTFAITDMFAHMPKDALAKNFSTDPKTFDRIPKEEKFIFPVAQPPALDADTVKSPNGRVAQDMSFKLTQQPATEGPGGAVRIADMQLHDLQRHRGGAGRRQTRPHPRGALAPDFRRMAVLRLRAGADDGVRGARRRAHVRLPRWRCRLRPEINAAFVENTGPEPLRFLELFASPRDMDVSLTQWMALTPHELVQAHLDIDRGFLDALPKDKRPVV
jgi:oxalate decarboxylase